MRCLRSAAVTPTSIGSILALDVRLAALQSASALAKHAFAAPAVNLNRDFHSTPQEKPAGVLYAILSCQLWERTAIVQWE